MNTDAALPPGERAHILACLRRLGLAAPGEDAPMAPLSGGVSSDILRVDLTGGSVCVKRALSRLKVAADWHAPVERNAFEVAWLRVAGRILPGSVPAVLAHAPDAGLFVMEYFDPARFPSWKTDLLAGRADRGIARRVGEALGHLHAATADNAHLARRFASHDIFQAIRLEPYFAASARVHPTLAPALAALQADTAGRHRVLVHGDVSPKNILVGSHGPVLLDAECACYGEPAFDLAFCLTHLLLKSVLRPAAAADYRACYDALTDAYLARVDWEAPAALGARTARLLGGLLLARVDGKSPVEYLTDPAARQGVRRTATEALLGSPADPAAVWACRERHLPPAPGG